VIQFTHRHDDGAFEIRRHVPEPERSAAQPAELLAQAFGSERLAFRRCERRGALDFHHRALAIARDQGQRCAGMTVDFE
jgi:hypothetical protein